MLLIYKLENKNKNNDNIINAAAKFVLGAAASAHNFASKFCFRGEKQYVYVKNYKSSVTQ